MDIVKFDIFENASDIYTEKDGKVIFSYYSKVDSKPFAWSPKIDSNGEILSPKQMDKIWVGDWKKGHLDTCPFLKNNGGNFSYGSLVNIGRLWFENNGVELKIISFWNIHRMKDSEVKDCIQRLSKEIDEDFSDWFIDISDYGTYVEGVNQSINELSPVSNYVGKKLSEKEIEVADLIKKLHTANYKEKEKIKKKLTQLGVKGYSSNSKGFGSDKRTKELSGVKSLSSEHQMSKAQLDYHYKKEGKDIRIRKFNESDFFVPNNEVEDSINVDVSEYIDCLDCLEKISYIPLQTVIEWFNENEDDLGLDYSNMTDIEMYIEYIKNNM